jgi:hypothetical protein
MAFRWHDPCPRCQRTRPIEGDGRCLECLTRYYVVFILVLVALLMLLS